MVWTREPASPATGGVLGGSGPTNVWLVDIGGGAAHTTGDGNWVGTTIAGGPRLTGVVAFAPDDVYVSGYINAVYHLDATGKWDHQVTTSGAQFNAIWANGPKDLFAVGTGVFHSTGDRTWTAESEVAFGKAVWGTGTGDIWTLDVGGGVHHRPPDGKWQPRQVTALGASDVVAIWGSSPTDIYILDLTTVLHSTGNGTWTNQPIERQGQNPPLLETFRAIWGTGPDDVYIGTDEDHLYRSVGDGKWYRETLPVKPGEHAHVDSIWGPTKDDIYVATRSAVYRGHPAP